MKKFDIYYDVDNKAKVVPEGKILTVQDRTNYHFMGTIAEGDTYYDLSDGENILINTIGNEELSDVESLKKWAEKYSKDDFEDLPSYNAYTNFVYKYYLTKNRVVRDHYYDEYGEERYEIEGDLECEFTVVLADGLGDYLKNDGDDIHLGDYSLEQSDGGYELWKCEYKLNDVDYDFVDNFMFADYGSGDDVYKRMAEDIAKAIKNYENN